MNDYKQKAVMPFHSENGLGCNYYRIPAMITTRQGVTIAAMDARFGGTHDSPNKLDTALCTSSDSGKTWSKPILPFHFRAYEDASAVLKPNGALCTKKSASTIDPCLLEDAQTGRIFLLVDLFPGGFGSPQAKTGTGYVEIDGEQCLLLRKKGSREFQYFVRPDGVVCTMDRKETPYSLNDEYELLENGKPLTVCQRRVQYVGPFVLNKQTGVQVPMNVFYADALFCVALTSYLFLRYSDDQGKTWSKPISINPMVKEQRMRVLVTGPGCGIQLKGGAHAGRLLFPVYNVTRGFHTQECMTIYSDDHGETWHLGGGPRFDASIGMMSESQLVELPDGSVQVFARTKAGKIATAHSADGGESFGNGKLVPELPLTGGAGCQVSALGYDGLIDGKPAVLISAPAGSPRKNGMIHIGLIAQSGNQEMPYTFDWNYRFEVTDCKTDFAYSCLTQLPNGEIGILYEQDNTPQTIDTTYFQSFSMDALMHK